MNASMFFLNGVVAKVTTGVAVIAVAAGGVQAVEKYELTEKLQQVSVVEQEIDLDAPLEEQFPGDQEIVALAEVEPEAEIEVEVAEVVEEVEEPKNHGQEVSEFAQTTELEGCEKGQAIAANASKNKSEDDDKDPCDKDDGEEDHADGGDEPADAGAAEEADAIEEPAVDDGEAKGQGNAGGNGKGKGKGK